MKFRYARYGHILRPVIPIRISRNNQIIDYQVLVDSGADLCLFGEEVGQAVNINVRSGKKQEVFGVGGKFSFYYLHKVEIEIGGSKHEIEVGFMPEVVGRVMPYGIVGQRGFFDIFVVKFDLLKEEIELKLRK